MPMLDRIVEHPGVAFLPERISLPTRNCIRSADQRQMTNEPRIEHPFVRRNMRAGRHFENKIDGVRSGIPDTTLRPKRLMVRGQRAARLLDAVLVEGKSGPARVV